MGSPGARIVIRKVALDQGVFAPIFLGNFLVVLGALQGRDWPQIKLKMKQEYSDILFNNWKVRTPAPHCRAGRRLLLVLRHWRVSTTNVRVLGSHSR